MNHNGMDTEKIIKGLEYTWEYIRERPNPTGTPKARAMSNIVKAIDVLKLQTDVVRCQFCKYFHVIYWTDFHQRIWPEDGSESYECHNPRLNCEETCPTKGPDWYCADGVRKEEDCDDR